MDSNERTLCETVHNLLTWSTSRSVKKLLGWKLEKSAEEKEWAAKAIESLVRKLRRRRNALDDLMKAISNPDSPSNCVTIARTMDGRQQIGCRKAMPHVVYCRLWRWPDLRSHHELQPLACCKSPWTFKSSYAEICVNPYHYKRVEIPKLAPIVLPKSSPAPFNQHLYQQQQLQYQQKQLQQMNTMPQNVTLPCYQEQQAVSPEQQQESVGSQWQDSVGSPSDGQEGLNGGASTPGQWNELIEDLAELTEKMDYSMVELNPEPFEFAVPAPVSSVNTQVNQFPNSHDQNFDPNNQHQNFDPNNQHQNFDPNNQHQNFNPNNQYQNFDPNNQHQNFDPKNQHQNFDPNNQYQQYSYCQQQTQLQQYTYCQQQTQHQQYAYCQQQTQHQQYTYCQQQTQLQQNLTHVEYEEPRHWASIAYYELNSRVGEIFHCSESVITVDGFTDPGTDRFCLGKFSNLNRNSTVENTLRHIGKGVQLHYAGGEVHIEVNSQQAVFVQSRNCNYEAGYKDTTVIKMPSGAVHKIFDSRLFADMLMKSVEHGFEAVYELNKMCTIRLSFVKGWGAEYQRHDASATPCWIEIHLNGPLKWLDRVLLTMPPPPNSISSVS